MLQAMNAPRVPFFLPPAGAVAYSGPFVPSYRSSLLADWTAKLVEVGLPHSPHANLIKTLADPVQVRRQDLLLLDSFVYHAYSCSDLVGYGYGLHLQHLSSSLQAAHKLMGVQADALVLPFSWL
jgi:hypothetical protein